MARKIATDAEIGSGIIERSFGKKPFELYRDTMMEGILDLLSGGAGGVRQISRPAFVRRLGQLVTKAMKNPEAHASLRSGAARQNPAGRLEALFQNLKRSAATLENVPQYALDPIKDVVEYPRRYNAAWSSELRKMALSAETVNPAYVAHELAHAGVESTPMLQTKTTRAIQKRSEDLGLLHFSEGRGVFPLKNVPKVRRSSAYFLDPSEIHADLFARRLARGKVTPESYADVFEETAKEALRRSDERLLEHMDEIQRAPETSHLRPPSGERGMRNVFED